MAKPESSEEEEGEEGLGEWFESLDEGESIPTKESSSVSETEEEVSAEIPEVSIETTDEIKPVEKIESRPQADIFETEKGDQPFYKAKLPDLTSEEREIMSEVREKAIDEIDVDPRDVADEKSREDVFLDEVKNMLQERNLPGKVSNSKLNQMAKIVVRDMIGFGLLDILLEDDKLEEIMVTATGKPVYVYDRDRGMCVTNISFEDEEELIHQIEKMGRNVGRRIDKQNPLLDATLPDGSRVNATIPPISLDGPTLTIRKFREDPLTIIDIIDFDTLSVDVAAFLWLAVDGMEAKPSNLLVAGGTASGKSTTLNTLTSFVRDKERVISIEDTAELNLPHEHWIRLETRAPNVEGKGEVSMEELVENSLRMRPDRIIVGEVRGPEAMTMFTGMNTGHNGALMDTSVVRLSDGSYELIGDLCEDLFCEYENNIDFYKDMEYIDLKPTDRFEVVSVDGCLKSGSHKVTKVWRRKVRENEELVKFKTRSGNEITLTETHPLFVLKDGEIEKREAGEVESEDFVACLLNSPDSDCDSDISLDSLKDVSSHLLVPKKVGEVEFMEKNYAKVPNNGGEWREEADYLVSQNANPVKIPRKVTPELAYITGAISGDGAVHSRGYTVSVTFDNMNYRREFVDCVQSYLPDYDFDASSSFSESFSEVEIRSKIFSDILTEIFGIQKGKKPNNWDIPRKILQSGDEEVKQFLAGLFDADASMDSEGPSIILVTKSELAARKVSYALSRLGIISVVKDYENKGFGDEELYRVIVRGIKNLKKFKENIPLRHGRKKSQLDKVLENQDEYRGVYIDKVPEVGNEVRNIREGLDLSIAELSRKASSQGYEVSESLIRHLEKSRTGRTSKKALEVISGVFIDRAKQVGDENLVERSNKLNLLANSDIYWDRVVEVQETKLSDSYVYDFTVDEDHNYSANNLVVSNCMGTVHSNSAKETITRLTEPPMNVPEVMIPALNAVVMQQRMQHHEKGQIRRITEIAELTGFEDGKPQLSQIYKWDAKKDKLESTGVPSTIKKKIAEFAGVSGKEVEREIKRRATVLEWMREKEIRDVERVGDVFEKYYRDSQAFLDEIENQSVEGQEMEIPESE